MSPVQPWMKRSIGGYIRVGLLIEIDLSTVALFQRALMSGGPWHWMSSHPIGPDHPSGRHAVNLLELYPDVLRIARCTGGNDQHLHTCALFDVHSPRSMENRVLCGEDGQNEWIVRRDITKLCFV